MGKRGPKPLTLEQFTTHFWERVDQSGGPDTYWRWQGGHGGGYGYGIVNARGILSHPEPTHRVSFWLTYGCWPPDDTRHICNDPPDCANPRHLLAGTHKQNMHDSIERGTFRIGGRTGSTWSKGDTLQDRRRGGVESS